MSAEHSTAPDPRVQTALNELRGIIQQRYPEATFEVSRGTDDPQAVHLTATVDVEDTDEMVDLVNDRMMELQIDEGLLIFAIPTRPVQRALDELWRPVGRVPRPLGIANLNP